MSTGSSQAIETHQHEVSSGIRFEFGKNWRLFLSELNEEKISAAEESLNEWVGPLAGRSFLDIGSGSGLSSLAARRLGATVHSFDYDPQSVACTQELRRRYFPDDPHWTVQQGSVLDSSYLASLKQSDVVYSWGVLHHTGKMWEALANVCTSVAPGGKLYIAIYNDQGKTSVRWRNLKRLYNRTPRPFRFLIICPVFLYLWGPEFIRGLLKGRPLASWKEYGSQGWRGMSPWPDFIDWIGGYPFEVATPDEIFDFYHDQGFSLDRLHTCGGTFGCNHFVFVQRG